MKRRIFLKLSGLGTTALSFKPPWKSLDRNSPMNSCPQMVGEVTQSSAILQTRLAGQNELPVNGFDSPEALLGHDIPGMQGMVQFEIADNPKFARARVSPWLHAKADRDFIVKYRIDGLSADSRYLVRVHFGSNKSNTQTGPVSEFCTLQSMDSEKPISFVVTSCLNLGKFFLGGLPRAGKKSKAAVGQDRKLGYPALEVIKKLKPAFWVQTGDTVYYDYPKEGVAKTPAELRAKWHRQMAMPRMQGLLRLVPVYLMKDDHDYRYNDGDNEKKDRAPSPELAKAIFLEQVPMAVPEEGNVVTYRTRRVNKHLQIWMPEGRDYRDPNDMPDGPQKSIWGEEQLEWIKQSLLASEATFKVFIVSSPLIGPDDAYKHDNHTNYGGFQHERDALFKWLEEHGFLEKNFYIITGDRHWQYHSIHPSGFEEFATGTLNGQNSRLGRKPGDSDSTDPLGIIRQPYIQEEPTGGFIRVLVTPPENGKTAQLTFDTLDENGNNLNVVVKNAK